MQAIVGQERTVFGGSARAGGDVDDASAGRERSMANDAIELLDLAGDCIGAARIIRGEWCHAPIGNRGNDDACQAARTVLARTLEELVETPLKFGGAEPAILVVDADQERHEREVARQL